jgi:hypothetical protein
MMSSKSRDTLLIWFGGVVTDLISEITIASLTSERSVNEVVRQRSEIKQLAEELSLGLRSTHSYCESVIQLTNSSLDINALEPLILSRASLNKSVMNLFNSIPDKFEKWLISDYPESWFRVLTSRMGLSEQFQTDRTIFTSQGGLEAMVPEVFDYITSASGHSLDECVVIDSVSSRAVQAVRYGLSAIIYVYPERLEHELALRGILETQEEVLHPQTSRRVDL